MELWLRVVKLHAGVSQNDPKEPQRAGDGNKERYFWRLRAGGSREGGSREGGPGRGRSGEGGPEKSGLAPISFFFSSFFFLIWVIWGGGSYSTAGVEAACGNQTFDDAVCHHLGKTHYTENGVVSQIPESSTRDSVTGHSETRTTNPMFDTTWRDMEAWGRSIMEITMWGAA